MNPVATRKVVGVLINQIGVAALNLVHQPQPLTNVPFVVAVGASVPVSR
jgi:hypothetical protein